MTIGFGELAILAMLVCGVCWIPAPAFLWHHSGRWFVFSTSLAVMLLCLVAHIAHWCWRSSVVKPLRTAAHYRG